MWVIIKKKMSFEVTEHIGVTKIEYDAVNGRYSITVNNQVYTYSAVNYYAPMIMMDDL